LPEIIENWATLAAFLAIFGQFSRFANDEQKHFLDKIFFFERGVLGVKTGYLGLV